MGAAVLAQKRRWSCVSRWGGGGQKPIFGGCFEAKFARLTDGLGGKVVESQKVPQVSGLRTISSRYGGEGCSPEGLDVRCFSFPVGFVSPSLDFPASVIFSGFQILKFFQTRLYFLEHCRFIEKFSSEYREFTRAPCTLQSPLSLPFCTNVVRPVHLRSQRCGAASDSSLWST